MKNISSFVQKHNLILEKILIGFLFFLGFAFLLHLAKIIDINTIIRFRYFTYFTIIFTYIFLAVSYMKENSKKESYKNFFRGSFIVLLILGISSVYNLQISFFVLKQHQIILENYTSYIALLFSLNSFLLLYTHTPKLEKEQPIKLSNRISFLILFLILVFFTAIKAPFFSYNFTGHHSMKYNTYVEPAKYMAERNDFTWYQQKYQASPIRNPEGISKRLPQLPLLEWSLATSFKLFPQNSIELNTRLITHTIGLLTLLFTFLLTRKWSNNFFALFITTLMATNSIVSFATFVTVYDGINFMFLLMSLFLLSSYLSNGENNSKLFIAGVLIGLATSIKISFLIWALPTSIFLILFRKKDLVKRTYDFGILYLYAVITYLVTRFSIPGLAMEKERSILIIGIGMVILAVTFLLQSRYKHLVLQILKGLDKRKLLGPSILLLIIILSPVGFKFVSNENLIENFLTDKRFLLNFQFYRYMFSTQIIPFVSKPLFLFSILGFSFCLLRKSTQMKQISFTFLLSGMFFFILASKSIFPHSYYTEIIVLGFLLGSTLFMYYILERYKKNLYRYAVLGLFLVLVIPRGIQSIRDTLSFQIPNFEEAALYLEENTNMNELYIDESYLLSLTLRTGRARVGDINMFSDEEFKQEVKEIGFGDTMEKYNVKYLITYGVEPAYEKYVHIFTDDYLESTEFDRGQIILHIMDPSKYTWYTDSDVRKQLVEEYNLKEKFEFEKQVGPYRFFRFKN